MIYLYLNYASVIIVLEVLCISVLLDEHNLTEVLCLTFFQFWNRYMLFGAFSLIKKWQIFVLYIILKIGIFIDKVEVRIEIFIISKVVEILYNYSLLMRSIHIIYQMKVY